MRTEVLQLLATEDLRPDLRRALVRGRPAHVSVNGNILEVEIDFEAELATVSDVLDASVAFTVPLAELAEYAG